VKVKKKTSFEKKSQNIPDKKSSDEKSEKVNFKKFLKI